MILYDFNLKLGDSILWINPRSSASSSTEDSLGLHDYYEFKLDTIGWIKVYDVSTFMSKVGGRSQVKVSKIPFVGGAIYSSVWTESFGFSDGDYNSFRGDLTCFYRKGIKEFEGLFYFPHNDCDYSFTGINTIESDNFKIINENDKLRIFINDYLGGATDLRIFDINGRVVKQCIITSSETTMNISNLTKGAYIVSVAYKDKRLSRKIVR